MTQSDIQIILKTIHRAEQKCNYNSQDINQLNAYKTGIHDFLFNILYEIQELEVRDPGQ